MSYKKERFQQLLRKYLSGDLTPGEYQEFWSLANEKTAGQAMNDELAKLWEDKNDGQLSLPDSVWDKKMMELKDRFAREDGKKSLGRPAAMVRRLKWLAAAALVLTAGTSVFLILRGDKQTISASTPHVTLANDREPGGNRAMLILSDGREIFLDSTADGLLATQGKTNIIKQKDGQLYYKADKDQPAEIVYNTLNTPRGGQYNITLPDGSKVWLNASSSLKYPVVFTGNKRVVQITGEAYFEVTKDPLHPFVVQAKQTSVEVLGTHFNINSYDDEELVKTTLLEGKVKINAGDKNDVLKPGQQAQVSAAGDMKIMNEVDLDETIAWKEGNFQFNDQPIQSIMRQLARWYDIDVQFEGNINRRFGGIISRNVPLSKVLEMLQKTGAVKLVITGKNVLVKEA